MSNTAVTNLVKDSNNSSEPEYKDTAYGLVQSIRKDLEVYGLNSGQVSFDVKTESTDDSLKVEYQVETLGWYSDDGELGLGEDPVSFSSSYSIESETPIPEDELVRILEDNLDDAAIRANGTVIREALSPDYDAF